jgi:hypothetical protein
MEKEKETRGETYCAMVAILAALYDPINLRENPGIALRSAERLIRGVPGYLTANPPWEEPLGEVFKRHWSKVDAEDTEAETWGFLENRIRVSSEKIFLFDQAVQQRWCRFKTANRLEKLLERVGYAKRYFERGQITEAGYKRALEIDLERKRGLDRTRKRTRRQNRQPKSTNANLASENPNFSKAKGSRQDSRRGNTSTKF